MRMAGLALFTALCVFSSQSWAYEEVTVTDGGSITGTVTMTGGETDPQRL